MLMLSCEWCKGVDFFLDKLNILLQRDTPSCTMNKKESKEWTKV